MSRRSRRVDRFADAIADDRRPRGFRASPEDAGILVTAVELGAARPGADTPSQEFVAHLARRVGIDAGRQHPEPHPLLTRRRLLGAGALIAAAAAGAVTERVVTSGPGTTSSNLVPDATTWTPVARLDSLPAGHVVQFSTGGVRGFLHNKDGQYQAVSAVCTHQGCLLRLDERAPQLLCPCHRAAFSLDGDVLFHELPINLPALPRVATRVRDGNVEVLVAATTPTPPTS